MSSEHNKLYLKFSNKRVNAQKEHIPFNLTFSEFTDLLNDAAISYNDLGIKGYHLARFNDTGDYSKDNCRFVWYTENYAEKKISEKSRIAAKANIEKFQKSVTPSRRKQITEKMVQTKIRNNTIRIVPDTSLSLEQINKRIAVILKYDRRKRGWVMECSRELGVSHTQLRRFLNKQSIV